MESAALGLYAGKRVAFGLMGIERPRPSAATLTGALVRYVTDSPAADFQPMNANFGLLQAPPPDTPRKQRKALYAQRALAEMERLENLEAGLSLPIAAAL